MSPVTSETHRSRNPAPLIVSAVIEARGAVWNPATRELASTDAQRVLEALIAEYGVEAAVNAPDKQGFRGEAYRYLLTPLHEEAARRRPLIRP